MYLKNVLAFALLLSGTACVLSSASSDLQSRKSVGEKFANSLNSLWEASPGRAEDFIREQRQVVRPGRSVGEKFANVLNSLCEACPGLSEDFIRERRQIVVRPGRSVGEKFANVLNSLCEACPGLSEDFIREQRQTVRPGRSMSSIDFGLKRRSNEAN